MHAKFQCCFSTVLFFSYNWVEIQLLVLVLVLIIKPLLVLLTTFLGDIKISLVLVLINSLSF